jgi:hypothetical protein
MRMILLAGVALLSACGGGSETNTTDMNTMATDNMMMDQNMMMDPNMMMDANGAMDANMAGGAAGTDAATANLMAQDAASNDADTNLANGL